jgi:hypothetical protein
MPNPLDTITGAKICSELLASGIFSCEIDFCADSHACNQAGACDLECNICNVPLVVEPEWRIFSISPFATPKLVLPVGANSACSMTANITSCQAVVLRHQAKDAAACCHCGGGSINSYGVCRDDPYGWEDSHGRSCRDYAALKYCTSSGGYGTGWDEKGQGKFDRYASSRHSTWEAVVYPYWLPYAENMEGARVVWELPPEFTVQDGSNDITATLQAATKLLKVNHADVEIYGHFVTAKCGFETVRGAVPNSLTHGKWYYEIVVGSDNVAQVGFVTTDFVATENQGVGDDARSWAFDGNRNLKWHDGEQPYGREWAEGDVVGCLLNLDARKIYFSLNGDTLGVAYDIDTNTATGPFYPAATLKDGVWQFLFGIGEVRYAPPDARLFVPTARATQTEHSDVTTVRMDGCQRLQIDTLRDGMRVNMVMSRSQESMRPTCIERPTAECDFWGTSDEGLLVLWIMLGSAGGLGILTLSATMHGERLRRRRQFQLVRGPDLRLNAEAMSSVLTTDDLRTRFAEKYTALQEMLQGYERRGFIDINCNRLTLLRDVYVAFQTKADMQDPRALRSRGIRVRFLGELGIDEGGLRREFYETFFRKLVGAEVALFCTSPDSYAHMISPLSGAQSSLEDLTIPSPVTGNIGYQKLVGTNAANPGGDRVRLNTVASQVGISHAQGVSAEILLEMQPISPPQSYSDFGGEPATEFQSGREAQLDPDPAPEPEPEPEPAGAGVLAAQVGTPGRGLLSRLRQMRRNRPVPSRGTARNGEPTHLDYFSLCGKLLAKAIVDDMRIVSYLLCCMVLHGDTS